MAEQQNTARRRRSSSILQVYHEPPEPVEQLSDRAALPNGNANWVNAKGEDGSQVPGSPRAVSLASGRARRLLALLRRATSSIHWVMEANTGRA